MQPFSPGAPAGSGPFGEQLLAQLDRNLCFEGFKVEVQGIELGGTAAEQTVSVDFLVSGHEAPGSVVEPGTNVRKFTVPGGHVFLPLEGPALSFTFTPKASVEQNLQNFRSFVEEHVALAYVLPAARHGGAIPPIETSTTAR